MIDSYMPYTKDDSGYSWESTAPDSYNLPIEDAVDSSYSVEEDVTTDDLLWEIECLQYEISDLQYRVWDLEYIVATLTNPVPYYDETDEDDTDDSSLESEEITVNGEDWYSETDY